MVVQTLNYVNAERGSLEANRGWKNLSAKRNRRSLLNQVYRWYTAELRKIDAELSRLKPPAHHARSE
ncbi:MAG TPA: hypothetical protein VNN77_15665 [candidate division Zixibacteria bacterium]|nr:hypothetical protein [candidate division Zixibacteria bacterium]